MGSGGYGEVEGRVRGVTGGEGEGEGKGEGEGRGWGRGGEGEKVIKNLKGIKLW